MEPHENGANFWLFKQSRRPVLTRIFLPHCTKSEEKNFNANCEACLPEGNRKLKEGNAKGEVILDEVAATAVGK